MSGVFTTVSAVMLGNIEPVSTSGVTFNCKLQKNGGVECTTCSRNNSVAPPVPALMAGREHLHV